MINTIPILTFHSIDSSGSVISITPSRFKQLLKTLKQKKYQTVTLNEIERWLSGEITFRSPRCVITFDDGFENIYHHAFPLLCELGYNATVFLATGYCDKNNDWLSQNSDIPVLPMLRWSQVREMSRFGLAFEAHTQSHPRLPLLSPEQAQSELLGSKHDIEHRLGTRVDYFAYPYRYFNRAEDALVREYFRGACSTCLDFVRTQSDLYLLPRIDTYYFSHVIASKLFASPLFRPYLAARSVFRQLRQSTKDRYA